MKLMCEPHCVSLVYFRACSSFKLIYYNRSNVNESIVQQQKKLFCSIVDEGYRYSLLQNRSTLQHRGRRELFCKTGQHFSIGDEGNSFAIQSCSKPISYLIALQNFGFTYCSDHVMPRTSKSKTYKSSGRSSKKEVHHRSMKVLVVRKKLYIVEDEEVQRV